MKLPLFTQNFKTACLIVFIIFSTFRMLTAQNSSHPMEYYGKEASDIIPGAYYVKTGKNTPFPAFVKFDPENGFPVTDFFNWLKSTVVSNSATDFILMNQEKDELGFEHFRYRQTYQGIPIDNTMYILHVKDGRVTSFNGITRDARDLSVTPLLSEEEALDLALQYVGSDRYMWEDDYWENNLKEKTGNQGATYFPEAELLFSNIDENAPSREVTRLRLAYAFNISSASPHRLQRVCIDANTGAIVYDVPLESNCSPATVNTVFNGVQNINTDFYNGTDFRLRDDCLAAEIYVRDWGSATTTASPVEIENTTNTWTTQNERFGGSVLWCTNQAFSYFLNIHGRNSYDNANGDVDGYINAIFDCSPPAGCTTANNASMSFTGGTMKVGLSNAGVLTNSFATVDIIGHEYAHAVTGSSAMLVYEDEWGALNESFSDIFGETIEFFALGTNDWLIGDERDNGAIRSMSNPNNTGDPDTYLGTNWTTITPPCDGSNDECGVHRNSGVQNFWFFLLTEGGSGTNDNGDDFTVCGIGMASAEAIAFRNLTVYMGMNSDYTDARTGAIAAAEDLFGVGSNEANQVANAWFAVGVGTGAAAFSIGCPPANLGTIACNDPIPAAATNQGQFGALGGSINGLICGPVTFNSVDVIVPPGNICGGQTLTRTYTISDGTSMGTCVQTLTISPPPGPAIICPADVTISCDDSDDPSATGMATASVICGAAPSLNYSDAVVDGDCSWVCTTERTWTAEDECGNLNSCTQEIFSTPLLLIQQALSSGPIVLGLPGVSLTLTLADAECIVEWLSPGFGNAAPSAIPWGNHVNNTMTCLPGPIVINPDGTMANPLLAAQIFMAINLRLDPTLGDMRLSDTGVHVDKVLIISMRRNPTISDFFRLTNIALGNIYAPHLDFMTQSLQGINDAFSFCNGGVGTIVQPLVGNAGNIFEASEFGVNNPDFQNDFSIYPNPANTEVYFDLSAYSGKTALVKIYNLQGQLILIQKIDEVIDSPVLFKLQNFTDAIYMGVVQIDGEDLKTKKFIVER